MITDYQLHQECESIAVEVWGETDKDDSIDDRLEAARETARQYVDGHEYVIYTSKNRQIFANCNTDQGEAFAEKTGTHEPFTIDSAITSVVFGEMLARVETAIYEESRK
jgi:hypothetical protein